jgi:hypothetical protein
MQRVRFISSSEGVRIRSTLALNQEQILRCPLSPEISCLVIDKILEEDSLAKPLRFGSAAGCDWSTVPLLASRSRTSASTCSLLSGGRNGSRVAQRSPDSGGGLEVRCSLLRLNGPLKPRQVKIISLAESCPVL